MKITKKELKEMIKKVIKEQQIGPGKKLTTEEKKELKEAVEEFNKDFFKLIRVLKKHDDTTGIKEVVRVFNEWKNVKTNYFETEWELDL